MELILICGNTGTLLGWSRGRIPAADAGVRVRIQGVKFIILMMTSLEAQVQIWFS